MKFMENNINENTSSDILVGKKVWVVYHYSPDTLRILSMTFKTFSTQGKARDFAQMKNVDAKNNGLNIRCAYVCLEIE